MFTKHTHIRQCHSCLDQYVQADRDAFMADLRNTYPMAVRHLFPGDTVHRTWLSGGCNLVEVALHWTNRQSGS